MNDREYIIDYLNKHFYLVESKSPSFKFKIHEMGTKRIFTFIELHAYIEMIFNAYNLESIDINNPSNILADWYVDKVFYDR